MRYSLVSTLSRVALLSALLLAGTARAETGPALEIGLIPTLSTRTIVTTYQPLRQYLEKNLGRPVTLVTAPDYRTFVERTQRREYPLVITAPHFARLAQTEAGYRPLVRVKRELQGLLVVRADSPVTGVADLRGKIVSTPENLAIITMLGEQWLHRQGLEPGRDIEVRHLASFNSALLAVHNGESAAAITAATALRQMPEEVRRGLREIASTNSVPHVITLASPKMPRAEVERITNLLLAFEQDPVLGKAFFENTGFHAFVRPGANELGSLDPYVTLVKKRIGGH